MYMQFLKVIMIKEVRTLQRIHPSWEVPTPLATVIYQGKRGIIMGLLKVMIQICKQSCEMYIMYLLLFHFKCFHKKCKTI